MVRISPEDIHRQSTQEHLLKGSQMDPYDRSMKKAGGFVLAWWFMLMNPDWTVVTVGPYDSKALCEATIATKYPTPLWGRGWPTKMDETLFPGRSYIVSGCLEK
jgi:hypothetical protein